jgi:hypothetical protein
MSQRVVHESFELIFDRLVSGMLSMGALKLEDVSDESGIPGLFRIKVIDNTLPKAEVLEAKVEPVENDDET